MLPTALIVEDEPEANKLLAMLVRLRGYRADTAFTGGEALEKIRTRAPEIVFLDLMLPDIHGLQVCEAVKAGPSTRLVPVVLVTARVAAENRAKGFEAGADDYIAKPYTPDLIFRALAEADALRAAAGSAEVAGTVGGRAGGEPEHARQRARFAGLLRARTPLVEDQIARLIARLGRPGAVGIPPEFAYRLVPGSIALTLPEGDPCPDAPPDPFDEVGRTDSGGCVLIKRFSIETPS